VHRRENRVRKRGRVCNALQLTLFALK